MTRSRHPRGSLKEVLSPLTPRPALKELAGQGRQAGEKSTRRGSAAGTLRSVGKRNGGRRKPGITDSGPKAGPPEMSAWGGNAAGCTFRKDPRSEERKRAGPGRARQGSQVKKAAVVTPRRSDGDTFGSGFGRE